jgi:hypothetical protein
MNAWRRVNYCADGMRTPVQQYTVCHPPCKDTNHLSCSVFLYFIKCQSRETTIAFDFPLPEGFSKTKTHQKWVLMRLNATTLTDKKTNLQF